MSQTAALFSVSHVKPAKGHVGVELAKSHALKYTIQNRIYRIYIYIDIEIEGNELWTEIHHVP